jgi:hypothetical protein
MMLAILLQSLATLQQIAYLLQHYILVLNAGEVHVAALHYYGNLDVDWRACTCRVLRGHPPMVVPSDEEAGGHQTLLVCPFASSSINM